MSQTRKRSAIESGVGTSIGLCYAIPVNYVFLHLIHWEPWFQATVLTVLFTVISFFVKLITRRFFNWLDEKYPT